MAHRLNGNFYLYTGVDGTDNEAECNEAKEFLKETIGLDFVSMHYNDANQTIEVYRNLTTWFYHENNELKLKYPFVIYDQLFDLTDKPNRIPKYINGLEAIKSTDWNSLVNFVG